MNLADSGSDSDSDYKNAKKMSVRTGHQVFVPPHRRGSEPLLELPKDTKPVRDEKLVKDEKIGKDEKYNECNKTEKMKPTEKSKKTPRKATI